jgi:hypothetical protein
LLTHIVATESVLVVHADEKLTAFVELELAIRACGDCKPAPQTVLNNQ